MIDEVTETPVFGVNDVVANEVIAFSVEELVMLFGIETDDMVKEVIALFVPLVTDTPVLGVNEAVANDVIAFALDVTEIPVLGVNEEVASVFIAVKLLVTEIPVLGVKEEYVISVTAGHCPNGATFKAFTIDSPSTVTSRTPLNSLATYVCTGIKLVPSK